MPQTGQGAATSNPHTPESLPITKQSQSLAGSAARLTGEQVAALSRCAKGISLRFDTVEIVDALISCGYAQRGLVGVVTVTAEGREYLRMHAKGIAAAAYT